MNPCRGHLRLLALGRDQCALPPPPVTRWPLLHIAHRSYTHDAELSGDTPGPRRDARSRRARKFKSYVMGRTSTEPELFRYADTKSDPTRAGRPAWKSKSVKLGLYGLNDRHDAEVGEPVPGDSKTVYVSVKLGSDESGSKVLNSTWSGVPDMFPRSQYWRDTSSQLHAVYDKRNAQYLKRPPQPELGDAMGIWTMSENVELGPEFLQNFLNENGDFSPRFWERFVLHTMWSDPIRLIPFIRITLERYPQSRVHCAIAIDYIVAHLAHPQYSSDVKDDDRLQAFHDLAELAPQCYFPGARDREAMYFRLISHCQPEVVERLFQDVLERCIPTSWHTWLQFCHSFVNNSRYELALEAIFNASNTGAEKQHLAYCMACASLLRKAIREPDGLRICLRLVDHLTRSGFDMDIDICNILILNCADVRDVTTALSIYRSMTDNNVQPNASTFGVLLQAWKVTGDDTELLNDVIRDAISTGCIKQSATLAGEVLHCLMLHHRKQDPKAAFDIVADAYSELFHVAPLQKLGLLTNKPILPDGERLAPTLGAFQLMVWSYLNHLAANMQPVSRARELYQRWRALLLSGEMPWAALAQTNHVYNFFLHYFGLKSETLMDATQVIKDLQKGMPEGWPHEHAGPDAVSWSTLVTGFARHGKLDLAEQIYTYMEKNGINRVPSAYNSLLYSYAGRQELDKMIANLRRREADGLTWDRYTLQALSRFHDQARFQKVYSSSAGMASPSEADAAQVEAHKLQPPPQSRPRMRRADEPWQFRNVSSEDEGDAYGDDAQRYAEDLQRHEDADRRNPQYDADGNLLNPGPPAPPPDFTDDLRSGLGERIEQIDASGPRKGPAGSMPSKKADDEPEDALSEYIRQMPERTR